MNGPKLGWRDWIAAVWAEAHAVPPGLPRLAWRAGGIWMFAREILRPRRVAKATVFAAAAAAAAWAAWPAPEVGHAAVSQFGVVATVLLAGLPLLARWFLGPAGPSRAGRVLRVFCYAAVLALIPARILVEVFADFGPRPTGYLRINNAFNSAGVHGASSGGAPWPGEAAILLIIAVYVAAFLWLTSRRARLSRATLAIGAGTGLLLGVVMYAVAPLGLNQSATNPWLPGSDADPLVELAWLLLVGGPVAAAVLAVRACRDGAGSTPPAARFRQGVAAGVLANLTGALFVTALGTGTTALTLTSASLRQWLYHGDRLSALALYHREQLASVSTEVYVVMCVAFPLVGLFMSLLAAGFATQPPEEIAAETGVTSSAG